MACAGHSRIEPGSSAKAVCRVGQEPTAVGQDDPCPLVPAQPAVDDHVQGGAGGIEREVHDWVRKLRNHPDGRRRGMDKDDGSTVGLQLVQRVAGLGRRTFDVGQRETREIAESVGPALDQLIDRTPVAIDSGSYGGVGQPPPSAHARRAPADTRASLRAAVIPQRGARGVEPGTVPRDRAPGRPRRGRR
jgi:hypothetical protein